MVISTNLLNLDNPVFCNFLFWAGILTIKLVLMSILTGVQRYRFKAYVNEEDAGGKEVVLDEPHVERVKRAHLNDMENILPYLPIAILYICTDPNPTAATVCFRIATIARILHTIVYAIYPIRQPARAICFLTQYLITIYFAVAVCVAGAKHI